MKTQNSRFVANLCVTLLFLGLAATGKSNRPAQWATPITMAGAYNLHKVTDSLYRSAQPTHTGMKNLEKLGIKTVINLRAHHSDADIMKGTALHSEAVNIDTWHIADEEIISVLQFLRKKEDGPFLIHCQHGADRTGVSCAKYRIVVQGWTKEAAIDEMVNGGYGFHSISSNIIDYVKKVDVDKIKREAAK